MDCLAGIGLGGDQLLFFSRLSFEQTSFLALDPLFFERRASAVLA